MLSSTIDEGRGEVTKRFLKKIDGCIATCLKRRRGGKKEHFSDHELYEKLKLKTDIESVVELKEVEKKIADIAENNYIKIKDELKKLNPNGEGINTKQLWKLKRKMCPRSENAPSAMFDKNGNLQTSDKALQLFKKDTAGTDLLFGVLKLMNMIKRRRSTHTV